MVGRVAIGPRIRQMIHMALPLAPPLIHREEQRALRKATLIMYMVSRVNNNNIPMDRSSSIHTVNLGQTRTSHRAASLVVVAIVNLRLTRSPGGPPFSVIWAFALLVSSFSSCNGKIVLYDSMQLNLLCSSHHL